MFFNTNIFASALLIAAPFVAALPAAQPSSNTHVSTRGIAPDTCELVVSFQWDIQDQTTKIAILSQKNIFVFQPTDSTVTFLTPRPQIDITGEGETIVALKNGYKSVSVTTQYTDNVPQDEATLSVADFTIVGDSVTYNTFESNTDNVACRTIISDLPTKKIIIGTCEFSCNKLKKQHH